MKKTFIYTLSFLAFIFLFSSIVSADIILPNTHSLNRCARVVNTNAFPDVVLIGYVTGPGGSMREVYQINNNDCLTKGYKFNSLGIFWLTKEKFNSIGLRSLKPTDMTLLLENVETPGVYVVDSNPLVREDIEYSLAGFSGEKLILYKSKQTSEYNNGNPKKIETFSSPISIVSTPTPINGGWSDWSYKNTQCGYSGTQTRTCTNPSPSDGGANCSGSSSLSYTNQACPVSDSTPTPINGGWSDWSYKNTQCGYSGTQTRTCTNPSPSDGGANCSGSSNRSYTNQACPASDSIPTPTPLPPLKNSCLNLQNNLAYGSRSIEISSLQDFLRINGYLNVESTGYFGGLTLQAAKDFQQANKISTTGFVGPITREKIRSLACNQ
jgi:hypothetical protein